jgi:hypothetical protein
MPSTFDSFTEKSLQLMIDAYPEHITSVERRGRLPFHYACLNETLSLEVMMLFIKLFPESIINVSNKKK